MMMPRVGALRELTGRYSDSRYTLAKDIPATAFGTLLWSLIVLLGAISIEGLKRCARIYDRYLAKPKLRKKGNASISFGGRQSLEQWDRSLESPLMNKKELNLSINKSQTRSSSTLERWTEDGVRALIHGIQCEFTYLKVR